VRGLVLGKFLPPHSGHVHLVETAAARVDELVVLVCSLAAEPIPGALRHAWMSELVPRGTRVLHVTDENPSFPEEHPAFWEIWTATVRRACPEPIDVVFTSEAYGDELARRLGARHVSVDPERRAFPVSGAALRADPMAHWAFLPECVRPWYVRRVVVTGPESVGKTTLARELAGRLDTAQVPEYGRRYVDARPAGLDGLSEADFREITRGQIEAEEAGARRANRVLVCDTDLGLTCLYAERYLGACPEWLAQEAVRRRYALHLLLAPDIPWVPDPQRDSPLARERDFELLRSRLVSGGRPFVEVRGDRGARLAIALEAVATVAR